MSRRKGKRKLIAEINVVPYIDVTLVLLIVFMVTAPLVMQGVDVDLPQAQAAPIDKDQDDPLIVSIKADGNLFINLGADPESAVTLAVITDRVAKILKQNPGTPVLVWGDKNIPYGEVVNLMTALQGVGAPAVGLVTENP